MFQMGLCVIAKVGCSSGRIPEKLHNGSVRSSISYAVREVPGVCKSRG